MNNKSIENSALKVVVSSDSFGNPFLNVLMPGGRELPFVRRCTVDSNFDGETVSIATVELVVNISKIDNYQPPKQQTPLEFLREKGLISESHSEFFIQFIGGRTVELAELFSEYVSRIEAKPNK